VRSGSAKGSAEIGWSGGGAGKPGLGEGLCDIQSPPGGPGRDEKGGYRCRLPVPGTGGGGGVRRQGEGGKGEGPCGKEEAHYHWRCGQPSTHASDVPAPAPDISHDSS